MNIWDWARKHSQRCANCNYHDLEPGSCSLDHATSILRDEEDEDEYSVSIKCGPLGKTVWAGMSNTSNTMDAPDGWVIERVVFRRTDFPIWIELKLRRKE